MKKWIIYFVLIGLGALILGGCVGYLCYREDNYASIDGNAYSVELTELDLSGKPLKKFKQLEKMTKLEILDVQDTGLTAEDYNWIRQQLPNCRILWTVPLQGQYLDMNETHLQMQTLTQQDEALLEHFTQLEEIDLRQAFITVEDYERLHKKYPDCRILWSVPIQNELIDCEQTELKLSELTEADVDMLAYLPNLEFIDAMACKDQGLLKQIVERYPEVDMQYRVMIDGRMYREGATELEMESPAWEALMDALILLPKLEKVTLTGTVPALEQMSQTVDVYPDVQFIFDLTVFGVETSTSAAELYLNEIPMESTEEVEAYLKFFHNLTWVEMCDCGISSEEMDALAKRHPETRFIWMVDVGRCHMRTDIKAFIPYHYGYVPIVTVWDPWHRLFDEDCEEFKYCVDMECLDLGHMPITDYSFLQYMPKMKYLILADTDGTDFSVLAELKELIYLEIFMTEFTQTEVLLNLTKLEDLNLGFTPLTNEELLLEMPWLKRVWIPGTNIGEKRYRALQAGLPEALVVYYAEHSTDAGWRRADNYYKMRDMLGMVYHQ